MSEQLLGLRTRKDELIAVIQSIEVQLSQKDKTDPDTGRRLGDAEYHDWRAKAVAKRRHVLTELRDVKAQLTQLGEQEHLDRKAREESQMTRIELKLDLLLNHFKLATEES